MINPTSIAVEAVKVAKKEKSPAEATCYIFIAIVIEAFFKKEVYQMDALIYIPEGYNIPVFIMLIAFAFIAPLVTGMFFKNESKNKAKPWTAMYVSTLIIDMIVTPSLGLIAMSLIVQEFVPNIDPTTYMVILPIVLIIIAYLALKVMNEGLKAAYEQIKGVAKEAQEIIDDAKQQKQ